MTLWVGILAGCGDDSSTVSDVQCDKSMPRDLLLIIDESPGFEGIPLRPPVDVPLAVLYDDGTLLTESDDGWPHLQRTVVDCDTVAEVMALATRAIDEGTDVNADLYSKIADAGSTTFARYDESPTNSVYVYSIDDEVESASVQERREDLRDLRDLVLAHAGGDLYEPETASAHVIDYGEFHEGSEDLVEEQPELVEWPLDDLGSIDTEAGSWCRPLTADDIARVRQVEDDAGGDVTWEWNGSRYYVVLEAELLHETPCDGTVGDDSDDALTDICPPPQDTRTAPSPVVDVRAEPGGGSGEITLSWAVESDDVVCYHVLRQAPSEDEQIALVFTAHGDEVGDVRMDEGRLFHVSSADGRFVVVEVLDQGDCAARCSITYRVVAVDGSGVQSEPSGAVCGSPPTREPSPCP